MELTLSGNNTLNYNKRSIFAILPIFIILNSLKITVFNMFILNPDTVQGFIYKFIVTFFLVNLVTSMILKARSRFPFAVFYTIQSLYIFVNFIYYIYFHSYLHISQAFALSSEGMGAAGDLKLLMDLRLLIVLLDLPLALYIFFSYKKVVLSSRKIYGISRMRLIISCIVIIFTIEGWNYIHQYSIVNIAKPNDSASESLVVQRYGTLANSIADMVLSRDSGKLINELKYGSTRSGTGTNSSKPNFVVIQVESMDSSAVNKQHDGKFVMPFLHSLSQQNVYYPYTMSYHEAGGTSDCEFSTMNSVEPLINYPAIDISNYTYPNSIIRQLAENSYSTAAFHGDTGTYYNRDTAYPKMGYQNLFDISRMGLTESGWGAPDGDVFKYTENQLKSMKQPFFAYTITMTSHGPFTNANNYYNNWNYNDVKDQTSRDYMNSMSYVDQSIEQFVNYIRSSYKNTYIFIYGDHTPDVNSSEYKQASYTDADKYFEFVPLIIATPGNKQYTEGKIAASFLDIAPTIANASGVHYSINSDGLDLLNRTSKVNSIPFKGGIFDRSYLYQMVSQIKQ